MPDLLHRATALLYQCDPAQKAAQTQALGAAWHDGNLSLSQDGEHPTPPDVPGRSPELVLVAPGAVPRRRISTPAGRIALLHAIAHIELNAIDLALDMLVRFAFDPLLADQDHTEFATQWLDVAVDEARHFTMIAARLNVLGSHYGAFPAHQGLWEAAQSTSGDLAARLAIAPMLLEARGLDVTPGMIEKLIGTGDTKSADVLKIIYQEEIGHVAKGVHWFKIVCAATKDDPQAQFGKLVQQYLPAGLRPPFNHEARSQAGLLRAFYENHT
ncbi:MAG: rhamnosyltransferase [Robiginitomaculum sp.]|nr:MAG: rhamnosyltransferase [Robiginitomaculum sp.]